MKTSTMASSPSSPGSPTGTLTRDSSKKDTGKLGWVGTLTRRKKGQEGKLFRSNFKTFCFDEKLSPTSIDRSVVYNFSAVFFFVYCSIL